MKNAFTLEDQHDLILLGHKSLMKNDWFPISSHIAKNKSQEASVIFGMAYAVENYLLHKKNKSFKKNKFKFVFENKYIQNKFPYSAHQIRKGLDALEEIEFIKVSREGFKNRRVISMNWSKILEELLKWSTKEIDQDLVSKDEAIIDEMNEDFYSSDVNEVNH